MKARIKNSLHPALIEICRPLARAISSAKSALCFLFLFKPSRLRSSLCALCVLLWQSALAGVHYVDLNSTNATPPFTNWVTAATIIQDAVDAAVAGDEIVVTNGTYDTGGREYTRAKVDKPLSMRSVNGPQFTTITGGGTNRCVYLTNNASLSGFTLSNGSSSGGGVGQAYGGGAFGGTLNNCILTGNSAGNYYYNGLGGGAYYCTLNNCNLIGNSAAGGGGGGAANSTLVGCTLTGNSADEYGGGAWYSTLNNCTLTGNSTSGVGGGALGGTLNNCTLSGNSAQGVDVGGGASYATLNNCTLTGNSAYAGGGAARCTLNNCTLTGNSAYVVGDGAADCTLNNCTLTGNTNGGAANCTLNNCIAYFNGANNYDGSSTLNYCCTTPKPATGVGNVTNAPLFVDTNGWANLRLQSNSPCMNAGNNSYLINSSFTNHFDLDGNPRIVGGTVDIGAYEFQSPASMISYAWLEYYGLPINSSTDTADPDGDGVDNYHEWLAGTNPTNSLSSPAQLTITPSGVPPSWIVLTWPTNAIGFNLQSTTNLLSPSAWVTNSPAPVVIGGQNTVTNPITGAQNFYRLIQ